MPARRPSLGLTTYALAQTWDRPTAALRLAHERPADAHDQLLRLADEYDACGSTTMAAHARSVAAEIARLKRTAA